MLCVPSQPLVSEDAAEGQGTGFLHIHVWDSLRELYSMYQLIGRIHSKEYDRLEWQ